MKSWNLAECIKRMSNTCRELSGVAKFLKVSGMLNQRPKIQFLDFHILAHYKIQLCFSSVPVGLLTRKVRALKIEIKVRASHLDSIKIYNEIIKSKWPLYPPFSSPPPKEEEKKHHNQKIPL